MKRPRNRVHLEVSLEKDPIPGTFNTAESCALHVRSMLKDMIPHYKPHVRILEENVKTFDSECDLCDFDRHFCPGCGDDQDHSERSIYDGHTPKDCLS